VCVVWGGSLYVMAAAPPPPRRRGVDDTRVGQALTISPWTTASIIVSQARVCVGELCEEVGPSMCGSDAARRRDVEDA
jgi:hypothetical protein